MYLTSAAMCLFTILGVKAEIINLNGTVINQFDKPVRGAELVLLGDNSISATTDSAGHFELTGEITPVLRHIPLPETAPSVVLRGSVLEVVLGRSATVDVIMYTISGKMVLHITTERLNAGLNAIALPVNRFGAGYYLIEVEADGTRCVFSHVSSGADSHEQFLNGKRAAGSSATQPEYALITQTDVDTIAISADGYESSVYPVSSYQQSDIEILLRKISRLDYITRSCDDIEMPSQGGGQSGWGSRYWDCCKPSCSWPENTDHLAANCGIDGYEEIECYNVVGNEYDSWLEGTKSACETEDGVAYMCYRHTPFAVCEKLAYGFAAVPAENSACGKCFQLDFDGGFRHGEPKAAHAMVKGKTMIVMASNIGHDVSSGQFDIMIPGGGLGAFGRGCAKQWNVDEGDESVVGVRLGGFISKCQINLGWDADPEDLKECVRGMCDNLFGDDPSRHDLWEGCYWYVDWMHAVDNPTFTYKEVPCPQALIDLYYSSKHPRPGE
jgi:hypothetical protein